MKRICLLLFQFLLLSKLVKCDNSTCFTQEEFESAFLTAFNNYENLEESILETLNLKNATLNKLDTIYHHFHSRQISWDTYSRHKFAIVSKTVIKDFVAQRNYTLTEIRNCFNSVLTHNFCTPLPVNCNFTTTNYYRFDGQCNSLVNPLFGAQETPFARFLPPVYADDIQSIPQYRSEWTSRNDSVFGNTRKNPFTNNRFPLVNNDFSVAFWQIFTHETMKTFKIQYSPNGGDAGINCCTKNKDASNLFSKTNDCHPIQLEQNDTCYNGQVRCLHYTRSLEAIPQCNLSQRANQVNFHDPYINLELLFNEPALKHLELNNGLFNLENTTVMKEILVGFDERSMQIPGIFLILSFFADFYNQRFKEILSIKPSLGVDGASFESRKLTTALYQKLTVDLVKSVIPTYNQLEKCKYSPEIDPQVTVEYDIALRFFHYFIRDSWAIYEARIFRNQNGIRGNRIRDISIRSILDNLDLYVNNKCGLTHGLLDSSWNFDAIGPVQQCDFFSKNTIRRGIDLRAYDNQHAKIAGEPSYCETLRFFDMFDGKCDGSIRDEDFIRFIDNRTLQDLKKRYGSIANIGLTLGLDVETKKDAIGITAEKIIAAQMDRFICGDRFWYNHERGILNGVQRQLINTFPLFSFLCNVNNCNTTRIQNDGFFSPGVGNGKILCNVEFDTFDTRLWLGRLK